MMDIANDKQEASNEAIIPSKGKIEKQQDHSVSLSGHLHVHPSVIKHEAKERTLTWFHENTTSLTPFTNPLHPDLYNKEEGSIAELKHASSQGEGALVTPLHTLDNGHPNTLTSRPSEVKREAASEDEQKSNLAGDSLDISIKKEITDVCRADQDSVEDYENQMNTSEVEDNGEEMNEKSSLSDNDIAKTGEDETPQSIPGTDIVKHESMSAITGEMDEQHQNKKAHDKKQIFPKHVKRLCQTNDTGHVCTVCGEVFDNSQTCLFHIWHIHTSEKPYTCEVCGKAFKQLYNLNCHKTCHSNERPYSCDLCDKTFKRFADMKQHKTTHSRERPYPCDVCGKTFKRYADIKQHSFAHTDERPYSCDLCGKTFKRSLEVKNHKAECHSIERPYSCDICGNTFKRCGDLKQHKITHSNERPYSCNVCGKTFQRSNKLKQHEVIHSNKRPYSCSVCGKAFQRPNKLKQHEVLHSNERPFHCDECKKAFKLKRSLAKHQASCHSNKRLYCCDECGKTFKEKRWLIRHLECHHSDKDITMMKALTMF